MLGFFTMENFSMKPIALRVMSMVAIVVASVGSCSGLIERRTST